MAMIPEDDYDQQTGYAPVETDGGFDQPAAPAAPTGIINSDVPPWEYFKQQATPAAPRKKGSFHPDVERAIDEAVDLHGADRSYLRTTARIESGGDPKKQTGQYKGTFMLSDDEFRRYGGTGDIFDPFENAKAAALKAKTEAAAFEKRYGRQPLPNELYLTHQQGEGGYDSHTRNPDAPAWENMYRTAEGRQKGPAWAKQAVWGNLPDSEKRRFGSVENVTSRDFTDAWNRRYDEKAAEDDDGPVQLAQAPRGGVIQSDVPPWEYFKKTAPKTAGPGEPPPMKQPTKAEIKADEDERRGVVAEPSYEKLVQYGAQKEGVEAEIRQIRKEMAAAPPAERQKYLLRLEEAGQRWKKVSELETFARPTGMFDIFGGNLTPEQAKAELDSRMKEIPGQVADQERLVKDLEAVKAKKPNAVPSEQAQIVLRELGRGVESKEVLDSVIEHHRQKLEELKTEQKNFDEMAKGLRPGFKLSATRSGIENVLQGVGNTITSIPKFAGYAAGYLGRPFGISEPETNSLVKAAEWVEDLAKVAYPGDPARQKDFSQKLSQGAGSMIGFMGVGKATQLLTGGSRVAGTAGTALTGGASQGAETVEEATTAMRGVRRLKDDKGKTTLYTPEEKDRLLAAGWGFLLGTSEAIPIERALRRPSGGQMRQIFEHGRVGALEEGAQEFGQSVGGNLVARNYYDPTRDIFEGTGEASLIGGILGYKMGAAKATLDAWKGRHAEAKDEDEHQRIDKSLDTFFTGALARGEIAEKDIEGIRDEIKKERPAALTAFDATVSDWRRGAGVFQRTATDAQPDNLEQPGNVLAAAGSRTGRTTPPPLPGEMQQPGLPEPAAPLPPTTAEVSVLQRMGYTPDDIREMDPAQRAAEMEDAKSRGILPDTAGKGEGPPPVPQAGAVPPPLPGRSQVPDNPSAEPLQDILAQSKDLADPKNPRQGVYLSYENLGALGQDEAAMRQVADIWNNTKGEIIQDADGNGGMLAVKSPEIAQQVRQALANGEDIQAVIGRVTGAGQGKPVDASAVVQQVTSEGAVTRESAVAEGDIDKTLAEFRKGGRDARVVTPEQAIARREQGREPPPLPAGDGSRSAPVKVQTPEDVARAGERVADPTDAQKDAGNYAKGHIKFQGLDITIENPKGSIRRGTSPDGTPWQVTMPATYGYVKRTEGRDGDQVDVYVGDNPQSDRVFVVDQVDPDTGKFDEHKVFLGYSETPEVKGVYRRAFSDGRADERMGGITELEMPDFKDWLAKGKRTRPLSKLDTKPDTESVQPTETAREQADKLPDNLTDAERETLVKAWRYVNAIEQARAQGRDIQQTRLDIANELDADLASYGISFDEFPNEQSLREYLGSGRTEDQGRDEGVEAPEAAQAKGDTPAGSGRSRGEEAPVVQREQADGRREGDGTRDGTAQVERPSRYEGDPLSDESIDLIVDQWKYVREVAQRPKIQNLTSYVIASGGILDDKGEVRHIAGSAKERPGLINKNGMRLDDIARSAWEAGFMGDRVDRPSIADFLEVLQDDLHTGTVVKTVDEPLLEDIAVANEIARELSDYGVTIGRFRSEAKLREYFGQKRPSAAGEAEGVEAEQPAAEGRKGQAGTDQADEVAPPPFDAPASDTSADYGAVHKWWRNELTPAGRRLAVQDAGLKKKDLHKVAWQYLSPDEQAAIARVYQDKYQPAPEPVGPIKAKTRAEFLDALMSGVGDRGQEVLAPNGTTYRIDFKPRQNTYVVVSKEADSDGVSFTKGPVGQSKWTRPQAAEEAADDAHLEEAKEAGPEWDFTPHAGWRDHLIRARVYAAALKIDHRGMELPAIVEAIDRKLSEHQGVPDGITVRLSDWTLDGEEARLKGGEYKAIAERKSPWSVVDGYGDTPEAARKAALDRLMREIKKSADKQTSLVPEATTKEKIEAAAKAKERKGKDSTDDAGELFNPDAGKQTDLVDMAKAEPKQSIETFAKSAIDAARSVGASGRVGRDLVFINHAHRAYVEKNGDISLDAFKARLFEAWKARRMPLAIANVLDPKMLAEANKSRMVDGRQEWHVIDLANVATDATGEAKAEKPASKEPAAADLREGTAEEWGRAIRRYADENLSPKDHYAKAAELFRNQGIKPFPYKEADFRPTAALRDKLISDGFDTIVEARKFARSLGLDGNNKALDEIIEAAVVDAARDIVQEGKNPSATYSDLVALYNNQPNLASRTGTSVANQAYSTPMPLAYLASRLAGVAKADSVYEPTAGNGALLIEADPKTTTANELDPRRAAALRAQGFTVTENDGSLVPKAKDIDSVIMNPPFGAVKEGGQSKSFTVGDWSTTQIDHAVALNGLEAMDDNGKAVLILGGIKAQDVKERRKGYRGQAKREFYFRLYNQYNVVDHFTVSGDLYKKQGAGWPVDVIVIDGRGKSDRALPAANPPAVLNTWDELAEKLPNASNDARAVDETAGRPVEPVGQSADGNAPGSEPDAGTRSERPAAEPKAKPARVRKDAAGGQSGSESATAAVERNPEAGVDRDSGRTDQPDTPSQPRVKTERKAPPKSSGQANYEAASSAADLGTLIPVNMADAAKDAMQRVAKRHGDVNSFVATSLGYQSDADGPYFINDKGAKERPFAAEQIDAIASAIDNAQRGAAFIIGDQCVAGDTRIYDPVSDTYTEIKTLADRGQPIKVLALTPRGFKAVTATSPFKKGTADLYRVTLDDGRNITVTRQHRFLTPSGWLTLADGLREGCSLGSAEGRLLKNLDGHPSVRHEDGSHCNRKAQGYLGDCSACSYPCDEQPLEDRDNAQGPTPSPSDVLGRIQLLWQRDDLATSTGCSRQHQSIDRHSRSSSSPAVIRDLSPTNIHSSSSHSSESAPTLQSALPIRSGSFELDQEGAAVLERKPQDAASCLSLTENGCELRLSSDGSARFEGSNCASSRSASQSSQTHTLGSSDQECVAKLESVLAFEKHTGWRRIVSIEFIGHDAFYDMWVPGFENYMAEGLVNHNTGIGKGRTAAGMLRYAMRQGFKPVFVTEKPDLYGDMFRDLRDIGVPQMLGREPQMFITNAGATIPLDEEALAWKQEADAAREAGTKIPAKRGKFLSGGTAPKIDATMRKIANGEAMGADGLPDVIFTTYDQMNTVKGQETDRRRFLTRIASDSFVVLDESHNAGGAAKTGWEKKGAPLDRAAFTRDIAAKAKGVLFSSATYAKRPDVMDLYARTDMGRAVDDPKQLPALIQRGGVPMQQIVASMLANSGQYLRRERSFEGVEYAVEGVPVNQQSYRQFSDAIRAIFKFDLAVKEARKEIMEDILDAKGMAMSKDSGVGESAAHTTAFASIMHNIVNQMLLAIKSGQAAKRAIAATKAGEKPVIALANTNESFIKDFAEQENISLGQVLDMDFGEVLRRYLARTLRVTIKHPDKTKEHVDIPVERLSPGLQSMYRDALDEVNAGSFDGMPISPIDWIRHEVGQAGLKVAEVTGRQTMIDYSASKPKYVARPKSEMGPAGKRGSIAAFNRGSLDVLILNRSGSTGVSMHASKDFRDQRRRRMIIAQAEGNIDTHLQMLGRVHRTGQVIPPAYSQIAAEIPAEARPTAVLMKKMASLNANTTGARGSVFMADSVDFMNEIGDKVVADLLLEDSELDDELGGALKVDNDGIPVNEDAAKRATGRLVLLTPEKQAEFLERVQKGYKSEIEQLDALGENPLEAKTLDLQAKTLDTTILKPKQGESAFLDEVRVEKASVKAQGRAMLPSDIAAKVAESLKVSKPDGDVSGALRDLEGKGRMAKDAKVRETVQRAREWIRTDVADLSQDAKESTRRRHEEQVSRWVATMNAVYPGARVTLAMPAGDMEGIVMSVERTGKAKLPVALGSWEARIAVPDGAREYIFPFSKLFPPSVVKGDGEKGAEVAPSSNGYPDMVAAFEEARKEGRETRFIVTGNILGGFDQVAGKGRIVNYTTDSGEMRPGVLMGRDFDIEKFMGKRAIRFQAGAQVSAFLDKVPAAEVKDTDGNILIKRHRGETTIEMPASRSVGGRFYTDPEVRKAIAPLDFERRGNKMIAMGLPRASATAAIEAMRKVGAIFETREAQDVAQGIVTQEAKPLSSVAATRGVAEEDKAVGRLRKAIANGKASRVRQHEIDFAHAVLEPDLSLVPAGTIVATLSKVEPLQNRGPGAVKATFVEASGRVHTINISIDRLSQSRALFLGGSRPAILITHFGLDGVKAFDPAKVVLDMKAARVNSASVVDEVTQMRLVVADRIRSDFRHEVVHFLRTTGALTGSRWRRLVDHAESLGLLELDADVPAPQRILNREIGNEPNRTLREVYHNIYVGYENPQELIDQEAAAALMELSWLGSLTDADVAPVRDILDDIGKGNIRSTVSAASGGMLFALGGNPNAPTDGQVDSQTGQSMRRDLDSLGYYSKALEAARGLQAKGTPEQMLAQLKKAGVKDAEIEATGLSELFKSKSGSTTTLESDAITLPQNPQQQAKDFWAAAKALDSTLTGEAERAVDAWVGGPHDAIAGGMEGGVMIPSRLEHMPDADLDTMARPIREKLREIYGDTIPVYRGEVEGGGQTTGRLNKLVSYSTDRRIAERFAGVDREAKIVSEAEIAAAEREYAETGKASVGNRRFEKDAEWGAINLIDRHGGVITDTDSIRSTIESDNADARKLNAGRTKALAGVREVRIPVDAVIWATDRFNQKEIIARSGSEQQGDRTASPPRRAGLNQITRSEIISHLEENRVGLTEVVRVSDAYDDPSGGWNEEAKWQNYSLDPSNPTYRETVLHLPDSGSAKTAARQAYEKYADEVIAKYGERGQFLSEIPSERIPRDVHRRLGQLSDAARDATEHNQSFQSGHFSEPNIIGHMMTSMTRHEGKAVYTIDQIQSDWGQKLRDGGVRDEAKIAELNRQLDEHDAQHPELGRYMRDKNYKVSGNLDAFLDQAPQDWWDRRTMLEAEIKTATASAPGHPLVNTTDQWTTTTLRRAIRQAAEAGAEYIAIPHGDTVLSYNPGDEAGMRGFYGSRTSEGIVPKNLRKILEKIDKTAAKSIRVDKLETTHGLEGYQDDHTGIRPQPDSNFDPDETGFTLFPLTEKVRDSVMEMGQPLFSFYGGGFDGRVTDKSSIERMIREVSNQVANDAAGMGSRGKHVSDFAKQWVVQDEGKSITLVDLYEAYNDWADALDIEPMSLQRFKSDISETGLVRQRIAGRERYVGVTILGPDERPAPTLSTPPVDSGAAKAADANVKELTERMSFGQSFMQAVRSLIAKLTRSAQSDPEAESRLAHVEALRRVANDNVSGAPVSDNVRTLFSLGLDPARKNRVQTLGEINEAINIIQRVAGPAVELDLRSVIDPASIGANAQQITATEQAGLSTATAGGYYNRPSMLNARAVIGLALSDPAFDVRTTAGHEAFHHVEEVLATNAEKRLLRSDPEMRRMRKLAGAEIGMSASDPNLARLPDTEIRAIAFQRYRRMREEGLANASGIHIGIRKLFDRLARIFHGVRNLLRGKGYDSYEAIFERARTGEMVTSAADRDIAGRARGNQGVRSLRGIVDPQMRPTNFVQREPFDLANVQVIRRYQDRVPLANVYTSQRAISVAAAQAKVRNPSTDDGRQISLFKFDGRYYVNDGNHRVEAARAFKMPSVNAEIIELAPKGRRDDADVLEDRGPADVSPELVGAEENSAGAEASLIGSDPRLDMSPEARKARAEEMGFDTSRVWYRGRGNPSPIEAFDLQRQGHVFGKNPITKLGVFATDTPSIASNYAEMHAADRAYQDHWKASREYFNKPWPLRLLSKKPTRVTPDGSGGNIVPFYARPGRQIVIDVSTLPQDLDGHGVELGYAYTALHEKLAEAKREGYDTAIIRNNPDADHKRPDGTWPDELVLFNPADARSVNAEFDPAQDGSPQIMASLIPTAAKVYTQRWLDRLQPKFDTLRIAIQDKALPIRRQEEAIEAATGAVLPDQLRTYMAEAIYHGRAGERLIDLQQDTVDPLIEHLRANGIAFDVLGDYLYARHAIERNAAILQIDPGNASGSGMTDADASALVTKLEQGKRGQAFKDAAAMVDKMLSDTRDTLLRSGLITREQYDNWSAKYQHYVPLRGFEADEDENGIPRIGRGMDIRGPEAMQALGRRSKADNPAAYAMQQAVQAIIRSEKNRVDKTLYRAINAHPDPDVWRVFKGEAKRRINPTTGLVEVVWVPPAFAALGKENVFGVKIAGKQYYMEILHEPLARSLRSAQPGILGTAAGRALYKASRFYAQLVTSYNPEFVISNYLRDIQTALMNVGDVAQKPDGTRRKIAAEAFSFKSIRGVMAALQSHEGRTIFGTKRAADETMIGTRRTQTAQDYAKWFEEYRLAGGKISFIEQHDIDRIKTRIEKSVSEGKIKRGLRNVFDLVDNANSAVENGVRLSVFIALRKHGISQDRAAFIARELTVNFNRKGEWGPAINAFYLFFNASMQGTTRLAQAAIRSQVVRRGLAGIFLAGALIDFYNYFAAADDDDGENSYEKIKDWVKEKNMIVMLPGRKDYVQIPMPYGYNVFYLSGQKTAALTRTAAGYGHEKPTKALAGLLGAVLESFSPLGAASTPLQMAAPTLADPFVQIAENKNWFGGPIQPQKFNKNKPDSENFYSTAPAWAIDLARSLNRISGGNTARAGNIDVSPETIEHLVEFAGGGVAKFAANLWNTGERAIKIKEWVPEKTPFVRRVYGKATTDSRRRDFFEKWNEVDAAHFEFDAMRRAQNREGMAEARREYPGELTAYEPMRSAQRQLAALKKQSDAINLNRDLDKDTKEQRLKVITDRENEIILRALATYNRLKKEKQKEPTP